MKIEAATRLLATESAIGKTPSAVNKYLMTKYKGAKTANKMPKGASHKEESFYTKKDVVAAIESDLKKDGWRMHDNYGSAGHHWTKDDWKASVNFDTNRKLCFFRISYPNPKSGSSKYNAPMYD